MSLFIFFFFFFFEWGWGHYFTILYQGCASGQDVIFCFSKVAELKVCKQDLWIVKWKIWYLRNWLIVFRTKTKNYRVIFDWKRTVFLSLVWIYSVVLLMSVWEIQNTSMYVCIYIYMQVYAWICIIVILNLETSFIPQWSQRFFERIFLGILFFP